MRREKISIIGQCFNEEKAIPLFYEELRKVIEKMSGIDFEVIFVNDASTDRSLEVIREIVDKDLRVKCIDMSRNFGREACAMAGFQHASGDYVTTMDLDLQDPPELLIKMYHAVSDEGYDIAAAKAVTRKGYSKIHIFCIRCFYGMMNRIATVKIKDGQREYRLMKKQVVHAILKYKEYNLFNKGLLNDVGFKVKWIEYENIERIAGETKFPYKRMINYAVTGIVDYSVFPLKMISGLGAAILLFSIMGGMIELGLYLKEARLNYMLYTIIVSLFFGIGISLCSMGMIAYYIAQIHTEVKNRPLYIIKKIYENSTKSAGRCDDYENDH